MFKRLLDIFFSLLGLLALAPVLLLIALLVKTEDGGTVFYRGLRVGRGLRNFPILKFRTMVPDADRIGGPSTSADDPRITRIGAFLRRFKLDECPQLLNIFLGQMSFVGPRPEVPSEVQTYSEEEKRIFLVRPGLTDWASLKYHDEGEILRGSTDPHEAYRRLIKPGKIRLALKYVDEHSLWTDAAIVMQTVLVLVKSRT